MAAPGAGLPAGEPGQLTPDRAGGWRAVTATERGAAHRAAGIPNQDAVAIIPLANGGIVAAVADGHGHSRHFRSARGAQLAVSIACQAARDLVARPGGLPRPGQEEEELRRVLVPGIVARWRDAVLADVAAEPFTGPENAVRRGDDATIPPFSSGVVATASWLGMPATRCAAPRSVAVTACHPPARPGAACPGSPAGSPAPGAAISVTGSSQPR